ncbi:MAG: GIY-YIG nuclease family protein, partial [Pseudomonadota bacterium]|nr:GIY-YIG nuclease family protein [Pseudomonadota bacterium]
MSESNNTENNPKTLDSKESSEVLVPEGKDSNLIEKGQIKDFDIEAFLKQLNERPGVYRMFNKSGKIIYVGKAKNLKRRVSSYFKKSHDEIKTASMVSQVAYIEVTVTDTESEALILENTLIKRHKPKYNILFRDDK